MSDLSNEQARTQGDRRPDSSERWYLDDEPEICLRSDRVVTLSYHDVAVMPGDDRKVCVEFPLAGIRLETEPPSEWTEFQHPYRQQGLSQCPPSYLSYWKTPDEVYRRSALSKPGSESRFGRPFALLTLQQDHKSRVVTDDSGQACSFEERKETLR